jgi:hypothetical protein
MRLLQLMADDGAVDQLELHLTLLEQALKSEPDCPVPDPKVEDEHTTKYSRLKDRFFQIVSAMDSRIVDLCKQNTELESKLRLMSFSTEQATNCGRCNEYKHTPWRDEGYGYICATCLVAIKDEEIDELRAQLKEKQQ